MSAPPKPWERAGVNMQNEDTLLKDEMSSGPVIAGGFPGEGPVRSTPSSRDAPPAVPPRQGQQRAFGTTGYGGYSGYGGMSSYGGYGSYGSMYGTGYGSGYGGLGGYSGGMYSSPYGSMYGGYNRFGGGAAGPSSFVRQAEESSRNAFQSVESIVQAFGSVSMMLESTYYAVFNSFRAVLGVADQFSRMRTHFAQILSAVAAIRTIKWLFRKLLVLLRLREEEFTSEAWDVASQQAGDAMMKAAAAQGSPVSNWPVVMFFAVVLAGPYLIWRILRSMSATADGECWASGEDDHFLAVAEHDFTSENEDEVSFRRGQRIRIAPKDLQPAVRGWMLASVDGSRKGLIPANHVRILGKRKGTASQAERNQGRLPTSGVGGVPTQSNPPDLERTFAASASQSNAPGLQVQHRAGHEDLEKHYADGHGSVTNTSDKTASDILDSS